MCDRSVLRDDLAADARGVGAAPISLHESVEPAELRDGVGRDEHEQLTIGRAGTRVPAGRKICILRHDDRGCA